MLATPVIATAGAGVTLALCSLVVVMRKKEDEQPKANKEQSAEASFRVRRSQLMSISGRGNKNRKKQRGKKGGRNRARSFDGKCQPRADECNRSSWLCKLMPWLKQMISYAISTISFGYFHSKYDIPSKQEKSVPPPQRVLPKSEEVLAEQSVERYYDDTVVVGLDCEMVGGGKGGWKSLLARCSVVTLDRVPNGASRMRDEGAAERSRERTSAGLDENLIVLYDKYVVPKGRITDYRTEWSGITKDVYERTNSPVPVVSFDRCQNEVSQLLSSIEGKRVIVVGHALENDFDALEIERPPFLTRDTAFHPPYMRRVRKKLFPRKLSVLAGEELNIEIQQNSRSRTRAPPLCEETNSGKPIGNLSAVGHSSVEDAAAALRLYWHRSGEWERRLGYPLLRTRASGRRRPPLRMYLDGCNLPVGMRGVDFKELMGTDSEGRGGGTTISSETFRLVSRRREGNGSSNLSTIDWIPAFRSALSPGSSPELGGVSVVFDGSKFKDIDGDRKSEGARGSLETRVFALDSPNSSSESEDRGTIRIEITENGVSADDVLFHRCSTDGAGADAAARESTREPISLSGAIDLLSGDDGGEADALSHYVVVRRKGGGTKTHRKLFDRLNLRRPDEGALCLSGLTPGLRKQSRNTARELRREKGAERVVECELRRRDELRSVVVTDDVFLADRLVGNGALVLSYRQLTNMFGANYAGR